MSDTPLTDAVEDGKPGKRWPAMCAHARRMERDRVELIAALALCLEPTAAQTKWSKARALLARLKEKK